MKTTLLLFTTLFGLTLTFGCAVGNVDSEDTTDEFKLCMDELDGQTSCSAESFTLEECAASADAMVAAGKPENKCIEADLAPAHKPDTFRRVAQCTQLQQEQFASFRATYWACSDGKYYLTVSKFSASQQLWEPILNVGVRENW